MMPPALEKTTDGPMDVVGKGHDDSPLGLTVRSAFEVPIRASECSSDDTFSISSREIVMAPRRRSLSFASGLSRSSASFSASRSASKAISEVIRNGLTRVSDRMAEQHKMHGLSDLCKVLADDVFVPVTALRHIKYLGEGAFAEVSIAELSLDDLRSYHKKSTSNGKIAGLSFASGEKTKLVAVKSLKADVLMSEDSVLEFIEEIKVLHKLVHRNIVGFVGVGCLDSRSPEAEWRSIFLVQEFVDGGTLKSIILRQSLEPRKTYYTYCDALSWSIDIAEALNFMHTKRPMIIHRDIKADNIFVSTSKHNGMAGQDHNRSTAKVGDLGLATLVLTGGMQRRKTSRNKAKYVEMLENAMSGKIIQEKDARKTYHDGNKHTLAREESTQSAIIAEIDSDSDCGTTDHDAYKLTGNTGAYLYMAPEVLMSRPYNERVDVYSFGIILYELFSKRLVSSDFINTMEYDESEIFAQKAASGYRPPFPLRMPQEIRDIVNKCWSGVPELRPKMMDVVRDLRAIRSGGSMEELDKAFALKHQEGCCIIV